MARERLRTPMPDSNVLRHRLTWAATLSAISLCVPVRWRMAQSSVQAPEGASWKGWGNSHSRGKLGCQLPCNFAPLLSSSTMAEPLSTRDLENAFGALRRALPFAPPRAPQQFYALRDLQAAFRALKEPLATAKKMGGLINFKRHRKESPRIASRRNVTLQ
jgi:hypothetical protein